MIFRFRVFQWFYYFQYFLLAVDKLVFRYTQNWRDVAHNMVLFCQIYLLMMMIVISTFRWTMEVAWLYMVDDMTGHECATCCHLALGKVDKNHHLD